ncbi:MAG TPA: methyltransferase [Vicinamibacterales bacterium]|nr:methyltransferase [Vicinamibacterales bacterium]
MAERSRRLARWRVRLGYALGIVAYWLATPTLESLAVGTLVGAVGEALRIWAAGHLEKGREVTSTGPYAFTRHPLYIGSVVMGIGFAIAADNAIAAAIVAAYLLVMITAAIRSEEAHLTRKFGEDYPAYRSGRAAGASRRFSLERALRNREYRALVGFVTVTALLVARLYL